VQVPTGTLTDLPAKVKVYRPVTGPLELSARLQISMTPVGTGAAVMVTVALSESEAVDQPSAQELGTARELVRQARERGVALTGPDGLLKALRKTVIETALDEEMAEHLGYDKHAPAGRDRGNSGNGKRTKTVLSDACGEVAIDMPRDRDGTFAPVVVAKRQRRLSDVDEVVLSLYAKWLTTGEISAHFADIYGASVSKDTVSRITDRVLEPDAGLVHPATRARLRSGVHRRDHGEDPRRPSREPAGLRRNRGGPRRPQRHPGHVGRRRRRGVGEVADGRAHRAAQPFTAYKPPGTELEQRSCRKVLVPPLWADSATLAVPPVGRKMRTAFIGRASLPRKRREGWRRLGQQQCWRSADRRRRRPRLWPAARRTPSRGDIEAQIDVGGGDSFAFAQLIRAKANGPKLAVALLRCQADFTSHRATCDFTFALRGGELLGKISIPFNGEPAHGR